MRSFADGTTLWAGLTGGSDYRVHNSIISQQFKSVKYAAVWALVPKLPELIARLHFREKLTPLRVQSAERHWWATTSLNVNEKHLFCVFGGHHPQEIFGREKKGHNRVVVSF